MNALMFSMLFGSIGFGYFVYGKKQHRPIPLVMGMGLCVFPYFISSLGAMIVVGTILTALPWFLRD